MLLQTKMLDGRPVLIVGMIGFSGEQEGEIERLLAGRQGGAVGWRTGAVSKADAWWINGARAQLLADGSLRIGSAEPGGRSVRLALADVSRPVAFCEPLASQDLEPAYSFRIGDGASVGRVLDVMESRWLACTAVCRWLAARLIGAEEALTQRIYHLVHGDRLLAVVDRTADIGWAPGVTVADLERATWMGRPSSARFIPPTFQRTTIFELVWDYAVRSRDDLLPGRYRARPIHFRRPPKIPARLVGDDHLLVMRELVLREATFPELLQRTGLGSLQLAHALAALYYTGSITTDPRRAARPAGASSTAPAALSTDASLWPPSRLGSVFGAGATVQPRDFTVPACLPLRPDGDQRGLT